MKRWSSPDVVPVDVLAFRETLVEIATERTAGSEDLLYMHGYAK